MLWWCFNLTNLKEETHGFQDRISRAWIDAVVNLDSDGLPLNFADFEVDSEKATLMQVKYSSGPKDIFSKIIFYFFVLFCSWN